MVTKTFEDIRHGVWWDFYLLVGGSAEAIALDVDELTAIWDH